MINVINKQEIVGLSSVGMEDEIWDEEPPIWPFEGDTPCIRDFISHFTRRFLIGFGAILMATVLTSAIVLLFVVLWLLIKLFIVVIGSFMGHFIILLGINGWDQRFSFLGFL